VVEWVILKKATLTQNLHECSAPKLLLSQILCHLILATV